MNERSIIPKLLADLPRIAAEENWNVETIRLAGLVLQALIRVEQIDAALPAPDDERKH